MVVITHVKTLKFHGVTREQGELGCLWKVFVLGRPRGFSRDKLCERGTPWRAESARPGTNLPSVGRQI